MADAKVVFFANLGPELRYVVVDKALPGMDVAAVGMDVTEHEPPGPNGPLLKLEDVITIPPHRGSNQGIHSQASGQLI